MMKIGFFGGIYNNYLALDAAIQDAYARGADRLYCLGDLGAFGPYPDRVFPLLYEHGIDCVQGNYDHSVGNHLQDCQCGYTDPRDNRFAQISYDYTFEHTGTANRDWMRNLPSEIRLDINGVAVHLCHGSPRKTNEFLWESTTSTHFLNRLANESKADLILGTHSGIHWQRELSHGRMFVNAGVLGRPENDGTTNVWYTLIEFPDSGQGTTGQGAAERGATGHCRYSVEFIPLAYDHKRLAREMLDEKLPQEFAETVLTGWWTTCLEVLPGKERRRGQF